MKRLANISQFESLMNDTTAVINNRVVVDNGFVDYARNLLKPKREPKPEKLGKIKYGWKSKLMRDLLATLLGVGAFGSVYGGLHQLGIHPATVTPARASRAVSEHCKSPVDQLTRYLTSEPDWIRGASGYIRDHTLDAGHDYADKHMFKLDCRNDKNYQAAMQKFYDSVFQDPKLDEVQKERYYQGFDLFGRVCALLDVDLSDGISKIRTKIDYNNKLGREYTSWGGVVYLNANSPISTIAHELTHTLRINSEAVRNVMDKPGPLMGSLIDDVVGQPALKEPFPKNTTRALLSGDDYAAKMYIDTPYARTRTFGDNTPNSSYVYGMISRPGASKVPYRDNEYLTQFMTAYAEGKLPLLYAMDIRSKINEINKESRKIGTAYWSLDKRLADEITQTSKKMLINGMLRKLPMGEVLVQVKENAKNMASAYMDQKGKKIRQEFMW